MKGMKEKDLLWRGGEERIERREGREGRGGEKKRNREREPRPLGLSESYSMSFVNPYNVIGACQEGSREIENEILGDKKLEQKSEILLDILAEGEVPIQW